MRFSRQTKAIFTQKTPFFARRIFRNRILFFLSLVGKSDEGIKLISVNARFPKKDKIFVHANPVPRWKIKFRSVAVGKIHGKNKYIKKNDTKAIYFTRVF